jgi:radical S-adenosyl methionine domain-containing protein 2
MMKDSYLILDEDMCFLDKGDGVETKSGSILTIGVQAAMAQVKFDRTAFQERGGLFLVPSQGGCGSGGDPEKSLAW